jgi:hypothetical protein
MSLEPKRDRAMALDQTIAEAMSRELHKTAQPLTILQGLVELMLSRVSASDECRKLLERAGEEVPRLACCFDDVRKLAGLQRPAWDIASFPLSTLITDVLETLSDDLDFAGITFDVQPNEDAMNVWVNASHSRVFTAIRLVLMTLVDCFHTGDRIKISIETNGSEGAIRFRPFTRIPLETIAEQDPSLSTLPSQLEFAHLLFASAGGELRINETPDIVVMSLPAIAPQSTAQHRQEDRQERAMHV